MSKHISLLLVIFFFLACSDEDLSDPTASFLTIYDHSNADLDFDPIDVVETVNGFVVLSGTELDDSDFQGIQVMKVDEAGAFVNSLEIDELVIPVGALHLASDSNIYFFAAHPTSLNPVLIRLAGDLSAYSSFNVGGPNYPLASSTTAAGNLLLLGYDPVNLTTELSEIDLGGTTLSTIDFSIGAGDDVAEEIINHYIDNTAKPLAFFCGEYASGSYYFNGFYNYSLSLVFTGFDGITGVVQGQESDAGIREVLPLGGNNFAVAGYQFEDNYQLPVSALSTADITSSVDLYPGNMAELKPYTPSKIVSYTADNTYTVFAAETEGRKVVLHFYDASTGALSGIHHVGFINPFTFATIKVTTDNSLLVLGTTFSGGRYERIILNKLPEEEVRSILGL